MLRKVRLRREDQPSQVSRGRAGSGGALSPNLDILLRALGCDRQVSAIYLGVIQHSNLRR